MQRILNPLMIAAALVAVAALPAGAEDHKPLRTVDHVDLARYMGKWYEIATITAPFQKDCASNTTATYTAQSDGTVEVLNQCSKADGTVKQARGRAWVTDPATNARLKVSFIPWLRLSFLAGDYWIIDLGPDYEYAVVGHPSRDYGWVLSRTPELSPDVLAGIMDRLAAQGYDVTRFKRTAQK